MATKKISQLTAKTSNLGTEELLINSGGTSLKITTANLFKLGDNVKAQFGAGNDLSIHHDGPSGNSWIKETGGGDFIIQGSSLHLRDDAGFDFINCNDTGTGGDVTLFHAGDVKLATTSTGIDVTGNIDINGGYLDIGPSSGNIGKVGFDSNNVYIGSTSGTGQIIFKNNISSTDAPHSSGDIKMAINDTGIDVTGSVTVNSGDVGSTPNSWYDDAVLENTSNCGLTILSGSTDYGAIVFGDSADSYIGGMYYYHNDDSLSLFVNNAPRLSIDSGGDTIFYNASGTEKMRWDASAERLGIGISEPLEMLHIETDTASPSLLVKAASQTGSTSPTAELILSPGSLSSNDYACKIIAYRIGDYSSAGVRTSGLKFQTTNANAAVTAMTIDNSGNLILPKGDISSSGANLEVNSAGGSVIISTNDTQRYLFDSTALYPYPDNTRDLGYSDYRFKDLYLSGGVRLGGTGSANTLDDYEEGTWTPTLKCSTTYPTATVDANRCHYTKIGNLVTVVADISWAITSVGSGDFTIAGFPFSMANYNYHTLNSARDNSLLPNIPSYRLSSYGAGDYLVMYRHSGSNHSATRITHSDLTTGTGKRIVFSFSYTT